LCRVENDIIRSRNELIDMIIVTAQKFNALKTEQYHFMAKKARNKRLIILFANLSKYNNTQYNRNDYTERTILLKDLKFRSGNNFVGPSK